MDTGTEAGQSTVVKDRIQSFKKKLKDEEVKFRLLTSFKMTMIPVISFLFLGSYIYILLKGNLVFFQANELIGISQFEEIFYDSLFQSISEFALYGVAFFIFINITSIYISDLLLRPFRIIGDYCDRETLGPAHKEYNPDFFSELKVLSQFSEFFFNTIETAAKNETLGEVVIPKKYKKIHQPVFESVFFLHFSFYILAMILMLLIAMFTFSDQLYDNLIILGGKTLPNSPSINYFLKAQNEIIDQITYFSILIGIVSYMTTAYHLYQKVSSPAFAFFATMRSFLKGNYRQRVHLIGFPYLRDYSRTFNKYLDWVEKELVQNSDSKT